MSCSPRHVRKNRGSWERRSDEYQREHAPQLNRWGRAGWGTWSIPESRLGVLGDPEGLDVLEFDGSFDLVFCGHGQWIRLFRANGLRVGDLVELRPPANGRTTYPGFASLEWARQWSAENIWVTRKERTTYSPHAESGS